MRVSDLKWEELLGREFSLGTTDCYGLVRDFFSLNFDLTLTNYARPTDWWNHDLDLYSKYFYDEGFRVLDVHPSDWQAGDCFLMAIRARVSNHAAVLLPGGKILHHFLGRRSTAEDYRGVWRNTTTAVLRHKDVIITPSEANTDLRSILPHALRQKLSGQ